MLSSNPMNRIARKAISKAMAIAQAIMLLVIAPGLPVMPAEAASPVDSGRAAVRLPNGLRVVIVEEKALPVVSCQLWYRVGARHDPQGFRGTCHVIEHVLENKQLHNNKDKVTSLIGNAARFDAFTSDDFTVFVSNVRPSDLETAMTLQAERFKDPSISQGMLDSAAAQVVEEIQSEKLSPESTLSREVRGVAYSRHPYAFAPTGSQDDVRRLTTGVAQDFYTRYFQPGNATLVLCGRLNAGPTLAAVGRLFGPLPKAKETGAREEVPEPKQEGERRVYLKYPGEVDQLFIAFHTPSVGHPDAPALAVLESLLNNANNGILKRRFIDSRLCQAATASFEFRQSPGLMTFHLLGNRDVGSTGMLNEVDKLFNDIRQVTPEPGTLERAQNRTAFKYYLSRTGPYKTSYQLGLFDALGHFELAEAWPARVRAVTPEKIREVAERYLQTNNRSVGFLVAEKGAPPPKPSRDRTARMHDLTQIERASFEPDRGALLAADTRSAKTPPPLSKIPLKNSATAATTSAPAVVKPASPVAGPAAAKPAATSRPADSSKPSAPSGGAHHHAPHTTPASHHRHPHHNHHLNPHLNHGGTPAGKPQAAAAALPPYDLASIVSARELPSGIKLIVLPVRSSPVVHIEGIVKAGSAYDPADNPGLSELNVALMNGDSTPINRSKSELHQANRGLGPEDLIVFTPGLNDISFKTRCLSKNAAVQLKLLSHHLTRPLLTEASMQAAIKRVRDLSETTHKDPSGLAEEFLLRNLLASKSPYAPPEIHKKLKSIENAKMDEIAEFRQKYLVPSSTTIVMVGDITLETASQHVENAFKNWQGNPQTTSPAVEPNKKKVLKVVVSAHDSTELNLTVGRLLDNPEARDYAKLLLVDSILFKHPLYARLKKKGGSICNVKGATASSMVTPLSSRTAWSLSVNGPSSEATPLFRELKAGLHEFTRRGFSKTELQEMRKYVSGNILLERLSNIDSAGSSLIEAVRLGRNPSFWTEIDGFLRATDLDDLNLYISEELKPDESVLVVTGEKRTLREARNFKLQ
ncbi:MAG: insulinase family protein [Candidatus Melainabacteria bacterium]|nr:insulinase family protein [Candidatus Melainabacteria bacterium]